MTALHLYLSANLGGWRDIPTHAHPLMSYVLEKKGHTGVVLVSRCGYLSSVILSRYFLQTTLVYTPDLEHLVV